MNKIAFVAAAALVVGIAGEAQAQEEWFWGGSYSTALPLGNTKDFNEGFSFRGVTVEGRKIVTENFSTGLSFGWHVLNDRRTGTVELENSAVNGTFFTYTNSFPIFLNAHFYAGERGRVRPYLGLNVGTAYMERRAEVGQLALDEDKWRFAVAPEAGVIVPLGWYVRGFLSARYHYMTGSPTQQYLSFNVGIASN